MAETEKQRIERATAELFLVGYNARTHGTYVVERVADAPDVICRDATGALLQLEIVLLEDRPGDIKELLRKPDGRELERFLADMERVRRGGISVFDTIGSFGQGRDGGPGTVDTNLRQMLRSKILKDYGREVALVLRQTSPIPWDWDVVLDLKREVESLLQERRLKQHPFDRGIWIVARGEDGPTLQMVMPEQDRPSGSANA